MPVMPAICDSCGTVFPSGFYVENSINIGFSGCKSGPCPKCGGDGSVPDGLYNFIGDIIQLVSGPEMTVKRLKHFSALLEESLQKELAPSHVVSKIEQTDPGFLPAIQPFFKKHHMTFVAYISLLVSILSIVIPLLTSGNKIDVNIVINNLIINR